MLNYIILYIFQIASFKIIKIPFTIPEKNKSENYLKNLYHSNLLTTINIGTPEQTFISTIKLSEIESYILSNEIKTEISPLFNKEQSISYKGLKKEYFNLQDIDNGIMSLDNLIIKESNNENIKLNNFSFALALEISLGKIGEIKYPSCLGLEISLFTNNFIPQLYINKLIDSHSFTFEFNKNKGYLIIGENTLGEKGFVSKKTGKINEDILWSFNFNNVLSGDKQLFLLNAIIKNEIDLFIGPNKYLDYLWENYFKNKNCNKEYFFILAMQYDYFICDSNVDVKDFPVLKFIEKQLNFTFEFDYLDLFDDYEGKKYFKIIYPDIKNNNWVLGRIFLKKYQLYFDSERKTIGIFINKESKNNYLTYIIIVLFIIIIILIVERLIHYVKNPRRKKAYELDDGYDYITHNNNNEFKII